MQNLREIFEPTRLDEALKLLEQPDTVPMAGGSQLIANARRDVRAVVDLSALGLSYIREEQGDIAIGATTTLAEVAESPILRAYANGIVTLATQHTATSIMRNQSTIGGTIISEPDGILAVALLALDTRVTIVRKQSLKVPFGDFLSMREHLLMMAILTQVAIPLKNPRAALHTVARTPSDRAIVSVCAAARTENGVLRDVRVALGGVGATGVRATGAENALEGQAPDEALITAAAAKASAGLAPQGDFRGSIEYRKEMAVVLTRRALEEITGVNVVG